MFTHELAFRRATDDDRQLCFEIKKQALGPYIKEMWGWDDEFQQAFHVREFSTRKPDIVFLQGVPIGTWEVAEELPYLELRQFYLVPPHQRRGIGSELLTRLVARSVSEKRPIRLQFLKVNPVRSLYERFGFRVTGQTESHYVCEKAL